MSPAELVGICVASTGMYVALSGKADGQPVAIGTIPVEFTRLAGGALLIIGLLVLVAVFSRPVDWWPESLLTGPVKLTTYWLATIALLAGAAVVVLARTKQSVTIGVTAFALSGGVLAGLAGEWLTALTAFGVGVLSAVRLQQNLRDRPELIADSARRVRQPLTVEPLLLTLSTIVLIWSLSRSIHLAATTEAGPTQRRDSAGPSLPRAVLREPAQ